MAESKTKDMLSWTKYCVKKWIEEVTNLVDNSMDLSRKPRIKCPNCGCTVIEVEDMKCRRCNFIIPEELQPPAFDVLLVILKEDKKKRIQEKKEAEERARKIAIQDAREQLRKMDYYK